MTRYLERMILITGSTVNNAQLTTGTAANALRFSSENPPNRRLQWDVLLKILTKIGAD